MDRRRIWPDFRDAWIVHDDGSLVVIDKPEGVSSQAADPERPDDVVTRLARHLACSAGSPESNGGRGVAGSVTARGLYLGVHQRLDRDTSGLLAYARRREANPRLAAQFEGRTVRKTYVACVTGWRPGRGAVTLRNALAERKGTSGGTVAAMRVVRDGTPGAKEAVTHVKVLAQRGDRAMLELELATGRTHQARVQLAHAGAPIAGDGVYGGGSAPRLMLHASALGLEHPITGRPARFVSPLPPEFEAWLANGNPGAAVYDDEEALARALARAVERRWGLGRSDSGSRATTAFRLVNEEGDGLPHLAIDVYGSWLVVQLYGDDGPWSSAVRRDRLLDALHAVGFDGIYLKIRPKQANALVDTRRVDLAPTEPVRGQPSPDPLPILEEDLPLLARLGDGLSTGVFLDQRNNRRRVRALSEGKSVANLFAYTCGFTVAAAAGGARRTVSVDASVAALERGRANLAHAGVSDRGEHAFVAEDAFAWLARAAKRGDRYDLVVLDPPSYSTTKRGRFVADKDYTGLAAASLGVLAVGGQLLACTNHRGISRERFRRILFDAARAARRDLAQLKDLPEPSDYPAPAGEEGHMKSVLARV